MESCDSILAPPWKVFQYGRVASTMESARSHMREISPASPILVMASEQSAGRGRQGRSWSAPSGSFIATYGFGTPNGIDALSGFSLVVGVALASVLEGLGATCDLKWPNDILSSDGRKLAGVLIEASQRDSGAVVLVGIGINLASPPQDVASSVSLLQLSGVTHSPRDIALSLSDNLLAAWHLFSSEGFAPFQAIWESGSTMIGSEVFVQDSNSTINGIFLGVSPMGAAIVKTRSGTREFLAGDVVKMRRGSNSEGA